MLSTEKDYINRMRRYELVISVRTWLDLVILSQLCSYINGNISLIDRYIHLCRSIDTMQPVTQRDSDTGATIRLKRHNTDITMGDGGTLTGYPSDLGESTSYEIWNKGGSRGGTSSQARGSLNESER